MKIKKTFQGIIPENKILNSESTSETDTYSCNYINTIVEAITNGNGTAVKFKDGTMICSKRLTGTSSQNLWVSPLYYQDISNGSWSERFIEIYSVNATMENNQFWCNIAGWSLSSAGTTRLITPSANNGNYGIDIMAIGRWK